MSEHCSRPAEEIQVRLSTTSVVADLGFKLLHGSAFFLRSVRRQKLGQTSAPAPLAGILGHSTIIISARQSAVAHPCSRYRPSESLYLARR